MHPFVIEVIVFAGVAFVALTQVILPVIAGVPMFPGFRFRRHLRQLDEASADVQAATLDTEIARERARAQSIRVVDFQKEQTWHTSNTPEQEPASAPTSSPKDSSSEGPLSA